MTTANTRQWDQRYFVFVICNCTTDYSSTTMLPVCNFVILYQISAFTKSSMINTHSINSDISHLKLHTMITTVNNTQHDISQPQLIKMNTLKFDITKKKYATNKMQNHNQIFITSKNSKWFKMRVHMKWDMNQTLLIYGYFLFSTFVRF